MDNATGLIWSQSDNGEGVNWEDALAWVQQMNDENYLGYNDWRLPNAKELQSIVDYTRSPDTHGTAAIDPVFSATQITNEAGELDYPFYWSGTTFLRFDGSASAAVYVAFGEGLGSMDGTTVIDVHGAGCQRSDPKDGDPNDYPRWGFGPQGDVQRVFNYVRLVRDADDSGDQNVAPSAEAAGPYSGQVGDTITLDGSGSTDSDGTITAYAWDLDNDGQYDDATGVTANFSATTVGTYTVGLRVTDDDGAQDTDSAVVDIADMGESNQAPYLAHPIQNQTAPANRRFRLQLRSDTFIDPDEGQSLSYAATRAAGSSLPRWLRFDSQTRTFSGRPLVHDVGQYGIRVTATDSGSPALAAWTEFTIDVTPHPFPYQNADIPQDVDGSDAVTPLDVLILINWLNGNGPGSRLDSAPVSEDGSPLFLDVNGDNHASPIDVLTVVNHLDGQLPDSGEGESVERGTLNSQVLADDERLTPVWAVDRGTDRDTFAGIGNTDGVAASSDALSHPDVALAELDALLPDLAQDVAAAWSQH
jgi:hypothetical protein